MYTHVMWESMFQNDKAFENGVLDVGMEWSFEKRNEKELFGFKMVEIVLCVETEEV